MSDTAIVTSAAFTDAEGWALVDKIGWGKSYQTLDTDVVKYRLAASLGLERSEAFSAWVDTKEHALYRAIDNWEKKFHKNFDLGDDSFGDLISHIVGCGKAEYDAILANPGLAYDRARKDNFGEKFSYCVPSKYTFSDMGRMPATLSEIDAELLTLAEGAPIFTPLLEDVATKLHNAAAAPSDKYLQVYFRNLAGQADRLAEEFVGTKQQHAQVEVALKFFHGWLHRNYVHDVFRLEEAKRLGPL